MTSYQSTSAFGSNKITKSRSKMAVKPILKKLSHSEKSSLDLDRGWEDQIHYGAHGWGAGSGTRPFGAEPHPYDAGSGTTNGRLARDVSFSLSASDLHGGATGRAKYSHARSTSGTSHISVATTGSGTRIIGGGGTFVHPFQQTPRTSTPPLSYANSLASLEASGVRDYSPTITEDDDDRIAGAYHLGGTTAAASAAQQPPLLPQSGMRRPSLVSQRTSSLSDITSAVPPQLRINTTRSGTAVAAAGSGGTGPGSSVASSSRLAQGVLTPSRSDLQLNLLSTSLDTSARDNNYTLGSPSSSVAGPMSPLRTSLEGFRLRSRSEVDSAARVDQIRAARRRFEEKEKMKDEKWEREEMRRRDRALSKEAKEFERAQQAMLKKETSRTGSEAAGGAGGAGGRTSISADAQPGPTPTVGLNSTSSFGPARKKVVISHGKTGSLGGGGATGLPMDHQQQQQNAEKLAFKSRNYDSTQEGQTPRAADDVVFSPAPRRASGAKKKTQGAWTSFILWLKIKILRISKT